MNKGMISGLTASAIKTQTFVNTNGGVSFNSPIFKRVFTISSNGGLTLGSSLSTGRVDFGGNGGIYLSSSNTLYIGDTGQWGSINFQGRILIYTDIRIGYSSTASTIMAADGTSNVLCIRNQTTAQSFRIYRTTNIASGVYTPPTDFERLNFTWSGSDAVIEHSFGGTGVARALIFRTGNSDRLTIAADGHITIDDALNINTGTTTGTKLATTSTQKLGFWGVTPVVQPAAITNVTGGANIDTECRATLNDLLAKLRTIGIITP